MQNTTGRWSSCSVLVKLKNLSIHCHPLKFAVVPSVKWFSVTMPDKTDTRYYQNHRFVVVQSSDDIYEILPYIFESNYHCLNLVQAAHLHSLHGLHRTEAELADVGFLELTSDDPRSNSLVFF